jgi:hypothetical protein
MAGIDTSIEIDAPAETVWSVLADTAAYPEWNPFMLSVEGAWTVGSKLTVVMQPVGSKPSTFHPTVEVAEPGRKLQWLGSVAVPGIFDGRHELIVEPVDATHSRFVQREAFKGIAVPLLRGTIEGAHKGFEAMNAKLKERAEASIAAG